MVAQKPPLWLRDASQHRSLDSAGAQTRCLKGCLDEHPKCGYYTNMGKLFMLKESVLFIIWTMLPKTALEVFCLVSGKTVCSSSSRVGRRTSRGRNRERESEERTVIQNVNYNTSGFPSELKFYPIIRRTCLTQSIAVVLTLQNT